MTLLLLAALALAWRGQQFAAAAAVPSAFAWLLFGAMPVADRHNVGRIAWLTAIVTLVVTWTTAMLGAVLYAAFAAKDTSAQIWIPIMLLAATNVGGLLAVFRSSQTRTETSAALREVSDLRIAVLSAPVIEAAVSPPVGAGTRSTSVTGDQGPTRWRRRGSSPWPRGTSVQATAIAVGDRRDVEDGREPPPRLAARVVQVVALFGRNPFPSKMKRSARSVNRSAITCALSASGNTLGQSLNKRLVVMEVERRYS